MLNAEARRRYDAEKVENLLSEQTIDRTQVRIADKFW